MPTASPSATFSGRRPSRPRTAPLAIAMTSGDSRPKIRFSSHPNSAIRRTLLRMRYQSGLGSAAPLLIVVATSAGAYSTAPISAPAPAPTPSIASPTTAPDAPPRAAPQMSPSRRCPERLRLRRAGSGFPMARDSRGDLLSAQGPAECFLLPDADVHVVVVLREHLHHAGRAGQAGVRTDEHLCRAGPDEAVQDVL